MIDISNEAKREFLRDGSKKYINVHFPDGEHSDIGNSDIVSESLTFQENLCQQDTFKFGLCESNSISFQTGADIGNIKGKEIEVTLGVELENGYMNVSNLTLEGRYNNYRTYSFDFSQTQNVVEDIKKDGIMTLRVYFSKYTPSANDYYPSINIYKDSQILGSLDGYADDEVLAGESPSYIDYLIECDGSINTFNKAYIWTYSEIEIESICFIYSCCKLGRFTVDTCKKDSKGIRSVEAYTRKLNAKNLSDFEKWKRSLPASTNTTYTVDAQKYLMQESSTLPTGLVSEYTGTWNTATNSEMSRYSTPYRYTWTTEYRYIVIPDSLKGKLLYVNFNLGDKGTLDNTKSLVGRISTSTPEGVVAYDTDINFAKAKKGVVEKATPFYLGGLTSESNTEWRLYVPVKLTTVKAHIGETETTEATFIPDPSTIKLYVCDLEDCGVNYSLPRVASGSKYVISEENQKKEIDPYAYLEVLGKFGRTNRDGAFEEFVLSADTIYPANDLYPSDDLYAGGEGKVISIQKENVKSIYVDEDDTNGRYGLVYVDYLNASGEKVTTKLTLGTGGSGIYYIEDNPVFTLTSWSETNVINKLNESFIGNITNLVPWSLTDLTIKGMPWIESGDYISVPFGKDHIKTIVFSRNLKGVVSLTDSIDSEVDKGDYSDVSITAY